MSFASAAKAASRPANAQGSYPSVYFTGEPVKSRKHTIQPVSLRELKQNRGTLRRKEVIQPHLPIRLPCYDFVPITRHTFGASLLAVGPATSGTPGFRDVTGGVYKARERIHHSVADLRLLVIPTSCRRVAACNPN